MGRSIYGRRDVMMGMCDMWDVIRGSIFIALSTCDISLSFSLSLSLSHPPTL